ncbi:hypothetical protein IFM89_032912 [Coptis chinensis]|uniref:RRM domain-containing protein n=1 Tax=Coptis chinensis TaxID=261450 RepID=A0A835MAR6_9MAGN|nr:hypothetical protein IFM89_032912 [Coptis chinensis]
MVSFCYCFCFCFCFRFMAYQSIPNPSNSSYGFHLFNSPFGDTTYTKVFVGGLAWETQSETMCCYFDQFEDILEAVVITDRITRRSKGYGFVTLRDPEAAKRACLDPSPVIIVGGLYNSFFCIPCGTYNFMFMLFPLGHLRAMTPYFASEQSSRPYIRSPSYHQPVTYNYQQGFAYPQYG